MTTSTVAPPAWWQALQDDFGAFLRSPLRDDGGRFRADAADTAKLLACVKDDEPGAAARLALYHAQYWMRLFHVLQQAFPRTAGVVGPFTFNRLASAFLVQTPPRGFDLEDIARNFHPALQGTLEALVRPTQRSASPQGVIEESLSALLTRVPAAALTVPAWHGLLSLDLPWSMLAQALALDEACRRAFDAPATSAWAIGDDDIAAIMASRVGVRMAPSLSIVRVDWDLDVDGVMPPTSGNAVANAATDARATAQSSPPRSRRRQTARHHVVVHRIDGVSHGTVDAVFARVLARLRRERFRDLRVHFEQKLPTGADGHLQQAFAGYARRAAALGWWIGTTVDDEPT
ncbi:MAG: DUF2063 domain-containing protein [Deltaproteobacteria bacterium]|nr:DUF2063 domain-containing protein [Deltaproteobacteria bacterium]